MNCIDTTNLITIISLAVPLIISEVLAISNCQTNGLIHAIILFCKNTEKGPRCNG